MLLIICGVSGAGKTKTGELLSRRLGMPFFDADDFHPAVNVGKMTEGISLDDADRQPWLEALAKNLASWEQEGGAVLACSALKESYRATLGSQCVGPLQWVFLTGSEDLLAERLASRKGHYFNRALLGSQFEALEIPDYGWEIDVDSPPQDIVNTIIERLRGA